jgi:hypothetical protein
MRGETDVTFIREDSTWRHGGFDRASSGSRTLIGFAATFAVAIGYAWLLLRAREGFRRARIAAWLAPLGLAAVVASIVHFVPDGRWYVDARPGIALKALTWDTVYLLVVGVIAAPLSYLLLRIAERRRVPRRGRWVAATIGVLAGGLLGLYVATIGALVMAGPH